MRDSVRRIFVEKKEGFAGEAEHLLVDLKENLNIKDLQNIRIVNRYDVSGIKETDYQLARISIFSEATVDHLYDEILEVKDRDFVFAVEYLPGQYDQRADSAAQCIQILTQQDRPLVKAARVYILEGKISPSALTQIKEYCINPVDSHEASLEKPDTLELDIHIPEDIKVLEGFIDLSDRNLNILMSNMGFAMAFEDLQFCRTYFRDVEKRDPTVTELRVIDTYWSDHCRHTTFLTSLENITFEEGILNKPAQRAYQDYLHTREILYAGKDRDISLMDIALAAMKDLRHQGKLPDLDQSEEINACSIIVNVDIDGKMQEWLVMFKNETHNHPTEIEPFGGAATCLGGAIRDPLSGRSYVYQAMRVTGSGDPRTPIKDTLPGKLPQRKITRGAASGFSAYGNQIGLATGQVTEIYDEGFVAKRMEIGAVIGAAPRENVVREIPEPGDVILLLGGRTGRDGCGGATGSSKEHTEESLLNCGAEVQKGNPPTERKIQRLFRNPAASRLIRRCNDFGAGGVCVAIGELADSLRIDLDRVPKKYEGLDGTELAISESQERMAVVLRQKDAAQFILFAQEENLEAVEVALVTPGERLEMSWRGKIIVDISRAFLDTNGVRQRADVFIAAPDPKVDFFTSLPTGVRSCLPDVKKAWLLCLEDLNVCSQKGLAERFDSTIGAATVLMPFGGKYQSTPSESMIARLPVLKGHTDTGTAMSFGYNPSMFRWSPFHGAIYAIVEALSKIAASGGDYQKARFTFQEYFERLGKDPEKWGKPFSALLGAYTAQMKLAIPAIGGKDSMSGTFKELTVPPTLVAFAIDVMDVRRSISPEFKKVGSNVVFFPLARDAESLPDFEMMDRNYTRIYDCSRQGKILAASAIKQGGIAAAISKMCFGNRIGFKLEASLAPEYLFQSIYGSLLVEFDAATPLDKILQGLEYQILGVTIEEEIIKLDQESISLKEAHTSWQQPLEKIFPAQSNSIELSLPRKTDTRRNTHKPVCKVIKPRVFIPVFPGTNCEYDTTRAFEKTGGIADILVFKNLSSYQIEQSIHAMVKAIKNAQIIMIPGGFSAGDEPEGSGKFIATAFRSPAVQDAVAEFLQKRDGLILGICNGFQALIKLGLLPFGEIREIDRDCPTLTFNKIGRHMSCMVRTKIISTLSPWLSGVEIGDIHTVPVSHGEGRFVAQQQVIDRLFVNGQVATQYVNLEGKPTYDIEWNPNGSLEAIEGITSLDGRIFGKMAHSERSGAQIAMNVPGEKDQKIFRAGVDYFR